MSDINKIPNLTDVAAYINVPNGRYSRACRILVEVLSISKLTHEDMCDVVDDVAELLHGCTPSKRSGFKLPP